MTKAGLRVKYTILLDPRLWFYVCGLWSFLSISRVRELIVSISEVAQMTAKHKSFSRGYAFKNFEGQPQDNFLQINIPEKVIIPLKQGFGNEVRPLVQPGDKVAAGQIIARDDESVSSPVHSSVNGKVLQVEKVNYSGREINVVTIESDGAGDYRKLDGFSSEWENLSAEQIGRLIYLSGAGSLGKSGIPTGFTSSIISPQDVENVIIQGVGSEVHNLSMGVLLRDGHLSHFIDGLKILKKLLTNAAFHIALNKSQKTLITKVTDLLTDADSFHIYSLKPQYPLDYDEVLIPTLLDREFPHGFSSANIGVIVLDVQAVLHVYEAVAQGKPIIERTIALCGGGFRERPHLGVRIGSPIEHVVKDRARQDKELRFVRDSSLTGEALSDLSSPIDRTFNTIIALPEDTEREFLAFARPGFKRDSYSRTVLSALFKDGSDTFQKTCSTNLHGEERPCIFCTFCENVCPVSIIPHHLFHYVERDVIDETLLSLKIYNCIECNLCSYVCPSKISVGEYIKQGKQKLLDEGFECPSGGFELKAVEKLKSLK